MIVKCLKLLSGQCPVMFIKSVVFCEIKFNNCEIKYCITRKELAAIIFGLKQYRQYLLGRRFTIRSDHAALLYLRSAKELIGQ